MSRSYKKYPGWTDKGYSTPFFKRVANHKVRKIAEIANGGAFRKITKEMYNICDWKQIYYSRADVIKQCGQYYGSDIFTSWTK